MPEPRSNEGKFCNFWKHPVLSNYFYQGGLAKWFSCSWKMKTGLSLKVTDRIKIILLPMSFPSSADSESTSLRQATSPNPRLTPCPASGCTLWAASLVTKIICHIWMNFRTNWFQTSSMFIFLCSRFITIITRQRKINIKLVWNYFDRNPVSYYNIHIFNWGKCWGIFEESPCCPSMGFGWEPVGFLKLVQEIFYRVGQLAHVQPPRRRTGNCLCQVSCPWSIHRGWTLQRLASQIA